MTSANGTSGGYRPGPFFPQKYNSTVSYWQASNRGLGTLWNHGRTDPLPTDVVDYVIVGAGVAGCSLAYQITREGGAAEGKSVVVLDAKDVASCASGRNGGHIAPRSWELFGPLTTPREQGGAGLTDEQALDIMVFEAEHLELCKDIIEKEGLAKEVDFRAVTRYEIATKDASIKHYHELHDQFDRARAASKKHKDYPFKWDMIDDAEEARKLTRVKDAKALLRGPAGQWHPHKGTTALMRLALESPHAKCSLFSWTPVNSLDPIPEGQGQDGELWSLDCGDRGKIRARNVVLCTNAYSRHLFPKEWEEGRGIPAHIQPYRHQCVHSIPPAAYTGSAALTNSYSIEQGPYLIQTVQGGMIYGPFSATVISEFGSKKDMYVIDDDSHTTAKFTDWMKAYPGQHFEGWGDDVEGEGIERAWSGIICHSIDWLPLVGPVFDRKGLWAALSWNGHGMAKIINTTRCLATHLKTGTWDERLPACFAITEERFEKAKQCKPFLDYEGMP